MPPIVADTVAQHFDAVIGLDAHTDTHTAVVCDRLGAVLAQTVVTTDTAGTSQLLAWAQTHAPGRRLWAVDGTRSHGQGTTQLLLADGQQVVEATRPGKKSGRASKSDTLDAAAIARTTLATTMSKLAWPRADGNRETLRILLTYRRHLTDTRTATVNMFKALVLTADEPTRTQLRGLPTNKQARTAAAWPPPPEPDTSTSTEVSARRAHLAALATDITALNQRINHNLRQLKEMIHQLCPRLLEQPGVGPVTAATALCAWSHPGRLRNEADFAKLAGTAPVEASSGRIKRHRLNRGGDRALNSALHTIAITRRRIHPPTRDYVARRHTEGKTGPEITRCLKRYIARQLFKIMETSAVMG